MSRGRAYALTNPIVQLESGVRSDLLERKASADEPVQRLARRLLSSREPGPVLRVLGDELLEADGVDAHHVLHPELHYLASDVEHLRVLGREAAHLFDERIQLREAEAVNVIAALAGG